MVGELELLDHLVQAALGAGLRASPQQIISVYVALKSKPFLIVTGKQASGKRALLSIVMEVLGGGNLLQCQIMRGHVWSAPRYERAGFLAEAQARMNSLKIHELVEEACLPEHQDRVFIGCLNRISQAELSLVFSDAAFQAERGYFMRLPYLHLTEPLPWSRNLLLVASMDTTRPVRSEAQLQSVTTVIEWQAGQHQINETHVRLQRDSSHGTIFLKSLIREEQAACDKLAAILQPSVLGALSLKDWFNKHDSALPAMRDRTIYLANAWSPEGIGLFDHDDRRNLAMALDFPRSNVAPIEVVERRESALISSSEPPPE